MKYCVILILSLFIGCIENTKPTNITLGYAKELAKKTLIIDGHIDLPYRLKEHYEDVSKKTINGHTDYPRLIEGGLDAPFMSIYIPASYKEKGGGKDLADSLIDIVESLEYKWPKKYKIARSVKDVITNFKTGIISLPMGMENGSGIDGNLKNLQHFYERGIRYITLTHSKNNLIGGSSFDKKRSSDGLTDFGVDVVREMNRLGIMVDISHVSDSTFYDVLRVSKTPPIASHSSCRHFIPGLERNMSDDMIKSLAEKGGIIMINFGSYFVNSKFQKLWDKADKIAKENDYNNEKRADILKRMKNESNLEISIDEVVEHIKHVVNLVGVDHVGFGSDFDGVINLPNGLTDVSMYPNLIYKLLKNGFTESDIEKICSGNIIRVWKKVEGNSKQIKTRKFLPKGTKF